MRNEVVQKMATLHVLLVERVTTRNVYWVPEIVLDVVKMDTKGGILLLEMVIKFLLMFRKIMPQRRDVSMNSEIKEHSR